jgi:hypothetical protein
LAKSAMSCDQGASRWHPAFTGATYACPRCGSVAKMIRLNLADLCRAGYEVFGRDQYVVNWCGHGHEFITVPDTAGMWWLVPILGRRRDG